MEKTWFQLSTNGGFSISVSICWRITAGYTFRTNLLISSHYHHTLHIVVAGVAEPETVEARKAMFENWLNHGIMINIRSCPVEKNQVLVLFFLLEV
jgi:hypothetical protein